jgi:NADH dehydrogenase FAD-containing subunit
VSLIQSLPADAYNVTLISPQTYFAFTPLLPSACVGTVEARSLVEPLRKLAARVRGHYVMGAAVDLDMAERLVEVEVPSDQGTGTMTCYIPCTFPRFRAIFYNRVEGSVHCPYAS